MLITVVVVFVGVGVAVGEGDAAGVFVGVGVVVGEEDGEGGAIGEDDDEELSGVGVFVEASDFSGDFVVGVVVGLAVSGEVPSSSSAGGLGESSVGSS